MSLAHVTLLAALCIASGSACDLGPMNTTTSIGRLTDPSPVNEIASRNLIGLLEYVRRLMPVGIADIAPPLEPFVLDSLPAAEFHNPESKLKGTVALSNLVVSGAQGLTINNIEVQTETERVDFDITIPEIIADLDFSAINFVYDGHFVFNTSGHIQLTLTNLNAVGALSAHVFATNGPVYTITGLDVTDSAENVQVDMNVCFLSREILDEIKDVVFHTVGQESSTQMSQVLEHFTPEQVIEFLEGDGKIE